ncbi:trans-sulfuration enzyme family protein [Tumebacillus permanentifrigoris]|uniref:homocysteine desulfhydrase n=1 Tax=Tumebacillus permanentifrigoris TaxID=378543 RepID=A0A316D872_9BACL|nr:PLP-dependent aspartate aminotransferase family protein [Tumebacillus permanentifrigoris]PWK11357.1 methionine-gamma-lyase [Tumebacillus permanentifrigoris]
MSKHDFSKLGYNTRILHAGHKIDPTTGSHNMPIYQTSTFVFEDADQGAARFGGTDPGYKYSRLGNPNTDALAEKIAALENAEMGLCFGSGMAAISTVMLHLVQAGDHILAADALYGATFALFDKTFKKYGVETTWVDTSDVEQVKAAIQPNTKVIYLETPANPTMKMADIAAISELTKGTDMKVVVDNTFMSPYYQKPIDLGAHVSIHSATKYIGGHGDVVGGIAVGYADIFKPLFGTLKEHGPIMGPFDAFLLNRGVKTLALRMEQHNKNAIAVAKFLESHPEVVDVYYPGLESHPQHELAKRQMSGFGGTLSFEVKSFEKGKSLMNNVKLAHLAVSLGDVHTLIQHPASMTHAIMPKAEREAVGITDGLIRLSVGIEDVEDIIQDLDQALRA